LYQLSEFCHPLGFVQFMLVLHATQVFGAVDTATREVVCQYLRQLPHPKGGFLSFAIARQGLRLRVEKIGLGASMRPLRSYGCVGSLPIWSAWIE
jgi:hypothetical protein